MTNRCYRADILRFDIFFFGSNIIDNEVFMRKRFKPVVTFWVCILPVYFHGTWSEFHHKVFAIKRINPKMICSLHLLLKSNRHDKTFNLKKKNFFYNSMHCNLTMMKLTYCMGQIDTAVSKQEQFLEASTTKQPICLKINII